MGNTHLWLSHPLKNMLIISNNQFILKRVYYVKPRKDSCVHKYTYIYIYYIYSYQFVSRYIKLLYIYIYIMLYMYILLHEAFPLGKSTISMAIFATLNHGRGL